MTTDQLTTDAAHALRRALGLPPSKDGWQETIERHLKAYEKAVIATLVRHVPESEDSPLSCDLDDGRDEPVAPAAPPGQAEGEQGEELERLKERDNAFVAFLRRLRQWDHLEGSHDGPVWANAIDRLLAGDLSGWQHDPKIHYLPSTEIRLVEKCKALDEAHAQIALHQLRSTEDAVDANKRLAAMLTRAEAAEAKLAEVTKERDQARKAILSFGNDQQFDWEVLGRIDDLEHSNQQLIDRLREAEANNAAMFKALAEIGRFSPHCDEGGLGVRQALQDFRCMAVEAMKDNPTAGRSLLADLDAAEKELGMYKHLYDHAIECVDAVFQDDSTKPPPLLPEFVKLGDNKFDAVVKLATAHIALKSELDAARAEVERKAIEIKQLFERIEALERQQPTAAPQSPPQPSALEADLAAVEKILHFAYVGPHDAPRPTPADYAACKRGMVAIRAAMADGEGEKEPADG